MSKENTTILNDINLEQTTLQITHPHNSSPNCNMDQEKNPKSPNVGQNAHAPQAQNEPFARAVRPQLEREMTHSIGDQNSIEIFGPTTNNANERDERAHASGDPMEFTLSEYVDTVALRRLMEHPDIPADDLRTLRRYRSTMSPDGYRTVTYRPSEHGLGRIYADRGLSLQFFPKRIRHTLAADLYHDIDMVNAHPTLLLQLCDEKGWDVVELRRYVNNREAVLNEIMEACHVTRKQAKELLLRLMYGGALKSWLRDERVPESVLVPPFVARFEKELQVLQQGIWDEFPKVRKVAKKPKATKQFLRQLGNMNLCKKSTQNAAMGSCMSLVLQEREHRVMLATAKFFRSMHWDVGVYVFDGIMIRKHPEKLLTRKLLQQCEEFVEQETGLSIRLEEKPMDCRYDTNFRLSRWDLEYAQRLLDGMCDYYSKGDSKVWETIAISCKAIGMNMDTFWKWYQKQLGHVTKQQCQILWDDPRTNTQAESGWLMLERASDFLSKYATRPILDLQCPYSIDDLLQAKTLDQIKFLAPKVLALITGEENGVWFKKVILQHGDRTAVRFVRMATGLSSLADIYVELAESVQVRKNGEVQQKETIERVPLDKLVKKFVLSPDPNRMSFTRVDFYPYSGRFGGTSKGVFNTFAGFPFLPCEDPTKLDYDLIQPFLDGMKEVICNNDDAMFSALCDFYTDILRHPERKSRVCPVLYSSEQQVGKGFFTLTLGAILVGDELLIQIANDDLIVGTFNSSIEDKLIIIVDDPDSYGASYKLMGRLKNLISEPTAQIHRKCCEAYAKRSCVRCMYCTNTLDAISIEVFDKRFFVSQCNPSRVGQMDYFDQLAKLAKEHDYLLWNYFYHRPLSSENWKNSLPVSAIKRQILRKKFPMPLQFAISSAELWKGQDLKGVVEPKKGTVDPKKEQDLKGTVDPNDPHPIRWHYEALYQQYRGWAIQEGIDTKYMGKNWTSLEEPLKSLGIQPIESNKGRIMIQKHRLKGFEVTREQLLASVRAFLRKSGQEDADVYDPPDVEAAEDTLDRDIPEMTFPDVLGHSYKPIHVKRV